MSRHAEALPGVLWRRSACATLVLFLTIVLASAPTDIFASIPAGDTTGRSPEKDYRTANLEGSDNVFPSIYDGHPNGHLKSPSSTSGTQLEAGDIQEVTLFVGESRVLPTPSVARIAVGNGQIVNANVLDEREVIIFANAAGTSSLLIWTADGRHRHLKINVIAGDIGRIAREIARFLSSVPNARTSIVGDKIIVEGDELSDFDVTKIDELAKRYPQIVNFTNRIGWEQTVLMDVKIVEFPSSKLREIGLRWNPTGGAAIGGVWKPIHRREDGPYQITTQAGSGSSGPITSLNPDDPLPLFSRVNILSAVNMGLNAQLDLLAKDGEASILAQPQLSARNGAKATFLAGGEYPYTVSNANGSTVFFKPYGIRLDIEPRVDRNGIIRAAIESEVSAIDSSVSTPSGPALSTRKTTTEFNLTSGDTLVLAGLLSRRSGTDIDKLPFLGDIPVLGALFRSRRFQDDRTELVVFVTPTVIDSRSAGLTSRIDQTSKRLQKSFGQRPYLDGPLTPPSASGNTDTSAKSSNSSITHITSVPVPSNSTTASTPTAPSSPTDTEAERGNTSKMLRVRFDGLSLRQQPDIGSPIKRLLAKGTFIRSFSKDQDAEWDPSGWRPVLSDGIDGWVISSGVEEAVADGPSPLSYRVVASRLALRGMPSANASNLRWLSRGTFMEGTSTEGAGDWILVRVDGIEGWVARKWIAQIAPPKIY